MFENTYADPARAGSYARLAFPGTYRLAFRDLPELLQDVPAGGRALDFGCGAGRSTRFLRQLGYRVTGADISRQMIEHARDLDPAGSYILIEDGDLSPFTGQRFDLVLSAFAFDNIPGVEHRTRILAGLRDLLADGGRIVLICSRPELYVNEWASFTTRRFEDNAHAQSGETVWIIMTDVDDRRPIADLLWFDDDYRALFEMAGLQLLRTHRPLATDSEVAWVSETSISPWAIYVLRAE
jgi:SAM-dependent methyltransferase